MKVVDANLLLYSYQSPSPFHEAARQWLEDALSSREPLGIPMVCLSAFLRISTDTRLKHFSVRMHEAIAAVDGWLQQPNVQILHTNEHSWQEFRAALIGGRAHGAMVTDAQIASLAIHHAATLYTADTDFARFPGLRWINPIAKG